MSKYEVKEVSNFRISLMDNDKIIHIIYIDYAKEYDKMFNAFYGPQIRIYAPIINLEDYQILISKKYDKYIIETTNYWCNVDTGKDEEIEEPVVVCNNCSIFYNTSAAGEPALFELTFMREEEHENN